MLGFPSKQLKHPELLDFKRFQAFSSDAAMPNAYSRSPHPSFIRHIITQPHPRKDFSDCAAFQETAEFQGLHERRNIRILSKRPNERKKDLMNGFSRLQEWLPHCHAVYVMPFAPGSRLWMASGSRAATIVIH